MNNYLRSCFVYGWLMLVTTAGVAQSDEVTFPASTPHNDQQVTLAAENLISSGTFVR